jgi:hypothetical protein
MILGVALDFPETVFKTIRPKTEMDRHTITYVFRYVFKYYTYIFIYTSVCRGRNDFLRVLCLKTVMEKFKGTEPLKDTNNIQRFC